MVGSILSYKTYLRDGSVLNDAKLLYKYSVDDSRTAQDTLDLRPLTDGEGLYGSTTYGISNTWYSTTSLGTNRGIHYSAVGTDPETGALVVCPNKGTQATTLYDVDPETLPTDKPEMPPKQLMQ